mgnify:CR=1 FL=1
MTARLTADNSTPRRVLPTLVLAQLAGTSPWFAVNAVMPELQQAYGYSETAVGTLSSALQLGFIAGTLVFALLALADRFSARRLFLLSTLAAAGCTLAAAIAAGLAKGLPMAAAMAAAKDYVTASISAAQDRRIGGGSGPLHHFHAWW